MMVLIRSDGSLRSKNSMRIPNILLQTASRLFRTLYVWAWT